ncbi:putative dehydrogenase [Microbulbifer aggregans]|uniref:Putative dehydrogenase n=1 Tax=Microbulbifer aggregans TaxID=1769779 RepID=A0A1C9W438_9GAMM|nr:DUF1249 domain-containing protein [Microbulbifer aggregans]AOS95905.1 putative dehydrogenase [Microbulbifer aggregans]
MTPRKNLATIERKVDNLVRKSREKTAYKVDLPAYHADCDANYLRLCKLLPELSSRGHWRYQMPHGALELTVLERSRYTTEVSLSATASPDEKHWLAPPTLTVRLYHDARMAEVVAVDGRGPLPEPAAAAQDQERKGHNGKNARMGGADERQQANRFLGEWLGHCLANGRTEFELILDGWRL